MSQTTQPPAQLREEGRSALAGMNDVLAQLGKYDGDNEDVMDGTRALRRALTSMQTTFMLMANSLEEAIAAKEMATSNDQEEAMLKMFEAASMHDAGGDASCARLEDAEGEIAMLRSELDEVRKERLQGDHDAEAKLLGQVERLMRTVQGRDEEISDLTCRIDELENELDGAHAELEEAEGVNQHLTEILMKHDEDMAAPGDDSGGKTPPIDIGGKTPPISMKKIQALCKKRGIRASGEGRNKSVLIAELRAAGENI